MSSFAGIDRRGLAVATLAVILTGLACALVASQATSVTGTWTGWVVAKHPDKPDKPEERYVHAVLKHAGEALTGTAGPNAEEQLRILKGKVTTEKGATTVTFEFVANSVHTSFTLKLVDGLLKGEARIEGEDGQVHLATVELKRE